MNSTTAPYAGLKTLYLQLDSFISLHTARLKGIKQPTNTQQSIERGRMFIHAFLKGFLKERAKRSVELSSSEVTEANKKAIKLMGARPGIMSCMDSRLPVTIMFGLPMQAAKSMRLPGGDMPGFLYDGTGKLTVDTSSRLAALLTSSHEHPLDPRFQLLVSHTGCAARYGLEKLAGRDPADQGLYADIYSKNEQGKVLQQEYGIDPIGFVYDVATGYGYMGLSRDEVLSSTNEFGEQVLKELEFNNQIINTRSIAKKYSSVFRKNFFKVDWTTNHKESALRFMIAMEHICEAVFPEMSDQVRALYRHRKPPEIRMKTMLVLFNAFSGYLHDPNGTGNPYTQHLEECVVFDYKSKGPFKEYPAFAIAPIEGNVAEYAQLAQTIVRDNRRAGRVKDRTNLYTDRDFIAATVPFIYKAEVGIKSTDAAWELIRSIDWTEIAYSWQHVDLTTWLSEQIGSNISHEKFVTLVTVLNEMRNRLQELKNNTKTQSLLDTDAMSILPLLVSSDRQPQSIVQFIT
ncbi:hypothetical protein HYS00_03260 [Candidatus Microgenomates bacterium]|nr:hypothetical protein [Candidatus Microgenomates bacterium]